MSRIIDTSVTVRLGHLDEARAISTLLGRAYVEYETTFPWPELWDEYLEEVTGVHGRWGRSLLVVAERAGRIAGSVDYYPPYSGGYRLAPETLDWLAPEHHDRIALPPEWACVRCFAVDPVERGRGTGRMLLDHLIGMAIEDQATNVFLHSLPMMAAAMRLYERAGFKRYPERDLRFRGDRSDQLLAMVLPVRSQ